ncbi:hypothetical protein DFH06DRAFT_366015 [Mycena polygramma]|nr:hypothetical protein DFH06DRAFT_366015 [Mycena polygramma]
MQNLPWHIFVLTGNLILLPLARSSVLEVDWFRIGHGSLNESHLIIPDQESRVVPASRFKAQMFSHPMLIPSRTFQNDDEPGGSEKHVCPSFTRYTILAARTTHHRADSARSLSESAGDLRGHTPMHSDVAAK